MSSTTLDLPQTTSHDFDYEAALKTGVFTLASILTDPACKIHEFSRRIDIVDTLNPQSWKVTNLFRKTAFSLGIIFLLPFGLVGGVAGIGLRYLGCYFERERFIHWEGKAAPITSRPEQFSVLSWNICCPGAGYAISDGGVMPWPFRIEALSKKICDQNADVVCLSEVFDIKTATSLYENMKDQYAHFYFHIGPRDVGVSSGLFVASKFAINNPSFTAFPKEMLVGRTKKSEKGVFSFEVGRFATIFTTHLQNSEEPEFPTQEEVTARQQEMKLLMEKVHRVAASHAVIVTGDLNLDLNEYHESAWSADFKRSDGLTDTWGGDQFCATLVGRPRYSKSMTLDYTLLKNGTGKQIVTTQVPTDFIASQFTTKALSDHDGLYSTITL
jgi:exonuclease III